MAEYLHLGYMEKGKCLENVKDFGDRHRNVTQKPLLKNRAVGAAQKRGK